MVLKLLSELIFLNRNFLRWNLELNATSYNNEITKMPVGTDGKPQEIVSGTKKLQKVTLFMISG